MATIPRTYLITSKEGLDNTPLVNGQFFIIWDADEAWYDAPIDGTPEGIPVRRQISSVKVISTLPETPVEDVIYAYLPSEDQLTWDVRVWLDDAWKVVGNVTPDTKVKTNVSSNKFYITGTSDITDDVVGTLLKNADAYIQDGVIHADLDGNATTASTATMAATATLAYTANVAIKDNASPANNITSYIHDASGTEATNVGSVITFTRGDGTTFDIETQDTVYQPFTSVPSGAGLVAGTNTVVLQDDTNLILTGSGWLSRASIDIGTATTATSATNDSENQQISTTYVKSATFDSENNVLQLIKGDDETTEDVSIPFASYSVFSQNSDGLVPAPSAAGDTDKFLKGDGTWDSVPVSNYQGATGISGGTAGLVPPAATGQMNYFLRGDGSWGTTFSIGNDGLVPAPAGLSDEDKFLQVISDGHGGLVGHWTSSGLDTKNTAGASPYTPGVVDTSDLFTGDGTTVTFDLTLPVVEFTEVTINDVETFDYTYDSETNKITFTTAPADEAIINVSYTTYNTTEVMYLVGATEQSASPQTYTNSSVYIQDNCIYSNGYQVVDVNSSQDINNKTFGGNALNTAAFRRADDSVTITNITITETFYADGETTDFTVNNTISSAATVSVVVSEIVTGSETFTGDGTTVSFTLTGNPIEISSVTVGSSTTEDYTFNRDENAIIFDEAPENSATIVVAYTKYSAITTPTYTVDTATNTITFTTAPDDTDKIDISYITPDPDYDASDVPTNQAVISYTNTRISTIQNDLNRRVSIDMLAESYSSSAAYDVGDYCIYNDGSVTKLYICTTTISTAEDWDSTHWDDLTITEITDDLDAKINVYSSNEHLVGKWIDGSDLYEQTITLSSLTASTATTVAHSITADKIFITEGFTEYTVTNDDFVGMISAYKSTAGDEELCIKIDTTNITYLAGTNLANATAYITVRYTIPAV